MVKDKISVIVPAYNEEKTITRCLRNLTCSKESHHMQIIVVCNGCADRTEILARNFEPHIIVLSTPVASKTKAINLGEEKAKYYPIFYVDSDIFVSAKTIFGVAEYMRKTDTLVASPKRKYKLPKKNTLIKRYYTLWSKIQSYKGESIGSGIYSISKKGRERFGIFPEIINDDAYVSLHFNLKERKIIELFSFTIFPPKNIIYLIKIKTRTKVGNILLAKQYPELFSTDKTGFKKNMYKFLLKSTNKIDLIIYIIIRTIVFLNTYIQLARKKNIIWYKDESSRI